MEIKRINQNDLLVRFSSNPGTADTQEWLAAYKAELTGNETLTRIDLTDLGVLSSLGVNVIVGIYQCMKKQDGAIVVEVGGPKTKRVFDLFQLTDLFEVKIVDS